MAEESLELQMMLQNQTDVHGDRFDFGESRVESLVRKIHKSWGTFRQLIIWTAVLTICYDILTILIYIADTLTTFLIMNQFRQQEQLFALFIISLIFYVCGEIVHTTSFILRFQNNFRQNKAKHWLLFFSSLLFSPILSIIAYTIPSRHENRFRHHILLEFLMKQGFMDCYFRPNYSSSAYHR